MIDLNDVLATNFNQEEVIRIIQGQDQLEKFKLAFQIIFTTNIADLGWNLLNTVQLESLIDEKFIKDLLVPIRPKNFSLLQVVKFLDFILKQDIRREVSMAIQKHLATYAQQKGPEQGSITMTELMHLIDCLEKYTGSNPVAICTLLIKSMARLEMPREAPQLKSIKYHIVRIAELFSNLQINNEERFSVLEVVYQHVISTTSEPQPLVAFGFLVIPNEMISQAIEYFFKILQWNGGKIRDSIVIATKRLIQWQRSMGWEIPLDTWIARTLALLNTNGFNDIIDEIAIENIVPAFLSLLIPIMQTKMICVVQVLLENARNTKELFDKIVPRCTSLLVELEEQKSEIYEPLIELICETLASINQAEIQYKDLIIYLESRNRSPSKYISKRAIGRSIAGYLTSNARVGLENLGNTCYLNSILQALFMTKQFSREILVTQRFEERSVFALQELFALMLFSPRPEQNPKKVVNLIRPDDFLPGIQHDSSEFLGSLLDRLHELEKKRLKDDVKSSKIEEDWDNDNENEPSSNNDEGSNSASSSCSGNGNQSSDSGIQSMDIDAIDNEKKEVIMSNDKIVDNAVNVYQTYIQRIFGGKISTRYLCSSCNGNSINIDSFRDLQLSFPEKPDNENEADAAQYNVQQLLEFYFTTEELTLLGDNQYHCDNCKILCNGMRCTEILEPPRNLILTLKHFRYDSRYHTRSKLLYKVFHDEVITMNVKGSFSTNSTRSVEYKLYAAVIHSGTSLDSGHYFTIARECDNKWFKFNDSFVTKSSLEELRSLISPNTPYILFYQRLSTASSTIVHPSECATSSTTSLINPIVNENSFPEYHELSSVLRNLIDDDKNQFELEMMKKQQDAPHHAVISSRHDSDNDRGSSGSSSYGMDNFPPYIY